MDPGCLTSEEVADLLSKSATPHLEQRVEPHLAVCSACRELVAAAAEGALGPASQNGVTRDSGTVNGNIPSLPMIGDLLEGKYRLERVLGAGAMGVVFAARHEALLSRVAIKVLRVVHEAVSGRFLREARIGAMLDDDPGFVRVFDVGTLPSGLPFIVMEELSGEDLGRALARGPLPVHSTVALIVRICDSLSKAHGRGIVHRDLKPANLFLARSSSSNQDETVPKILDFGISKLTLPSTNVLASSTQQGSVIGTPAYMSPEQMRGERDVDARADVWALGVILFQCLTGQLPFPQRSVPSLAIAVASDRHPRLRALLPNRPKQKGAFEALEAVIDRCLAKDPAQRFASAAALAEALRPFGAGAPRRTKRVVASVVVLAGLFEISALVARNLTRQRPTGATSEGVPTSTVVTGVSSPADANSRAGAPANAHPALPRLGALGPRSEVFSPEAPAPPPTTSGTTSAVKPSLPTERPVKRHRARATVVEPDSQRTPMPGPLDTPD